MLRTNSVPSANLSDSNLLIIGGFRGGQNRFQTFAPKAEVGASVVGKQEEKPSKVPKEVKKVVIKPKSAKPIEG